MTLFEECLEALGSETEILSDNEKKRVLESFINIFPMDKYAWIDWTKMEKKFEIRKEEDIWSLIKKYRLKTDKKNYILWNEKIYQL